MFPVNFVDNLDTLSKGQEIYKRLTRVREKGDRHVFLAFCHLTDFTFPNILMFSHITKLDLGYNNLQQLPKELANLKNLQEIQAQDNPLLWNVPKELAILKDLRFLDLRNTSVFGIPREFAELQHCLRDLNLENCPLKPNLRMAYGKGYLSLFQYLQRKNDRRKYKNELIRQFREDIYPFDGMDSILQKVTNIFEAMKDFASHDLRKLIRHAPRILPPNMADIHEEVLRTRIQEIVEEDEAMQEVGRLQLKLRALYPESPLLFAADMAHAIYCTFPPEDVAQIFSKDRIYILDGDFTRVNLDSVKENVKHLRNARWYRSICERIRILYMASDAVTEELVEKIFDHCLESAAHDKELISRSLEKVLPPDFGVAVQMIEELAPYSFFIHSIPEDGALDVSMEDIAPGGDDDE